MTTPYVQRIKNKYPTWNIQEEVLNSLRPEEVTRVIYSQDFIEILYKRFRRSGVLILKTSEGQQLIMKLKRQIVQRKEYLDRVEDWECRNSSDFFDMGIYFRFIQMRMTEAEIVATQLCRPEVDSSFSSSLGNTLSIEGVAND